MILNYIAFAIPLFLLFIGLEYLWAKRQNKVYHNFDDSVANLSIGIAERLTDTLTVGAFYYVYDYLHRHYALLDIQEGMLTWVGLFLLTDFMWYWYHRSAHEVNILWGIHIVHHQSEEFNLTISARITLLQAVLRTIFWSVLPIVGFSADMIAVMLLIHGTYPFFTHTQVVDKLGFLEYFLVTPSHHRVHHACNPKYMDKNYGDVLIIWDKLFGTFVAEDEKPVFGITKPLKSYSFLWQYFHHFIEIFHTLRYTSGWRNQLKVLFGSPNNTDRHSRATLERVYLFPSDLKPRSPRFRYYVAIQIAVLLAALFLFILYEAYVSAALQWGFSLVLLITLINCGAILERRTWVFYMEYARIALVLGILSWYFPHPYLLALNFFLLLVPVMFISQTKRQYLKLIYTTTS